MTPAELVRSARGRHGLSQRALALRASTTQAWISAIERGQAHPSVETLRRLLLVMGEELVLDSRPVTSDAGEAPVVLAQGQPQDGAERAREVLSGMRLGPLGVSGIDDV
jgi:transcriptional regulator with XRE-family HTH domain